MIQPFCMFFNQNDIMIELSFKQNYSPLIMSLAGIKILTNIAHMRYRLANAMLQLFHKFDQSKCKLYCVDELIWHYYIIDTVSLSYCSIWPICNTIQYNAMLHLFRKFGESECNPYCVIVLTSESSTNTVFKRA